MCREGENLFTRFPKSSSSSSPVARDDGFPLVFTHLFEDFLKQQPSVCVWVHVNLHVVCTPHQNVCFCMSNAAYAQMDHPL